MSGDAPAPPAAPAPVRVVACVDDLMFLVRIRETARRHGIDVASARTADAIAAAAAGAGAVIVDLDSARLPIADVLAAVRAGRVTAGVSVIGFFSHVDAARGREAREAGFDVVLPRSAFVAQLDALLAAAAGGEGAGSGDGGEVG